MKTYKIIAFLVLVTLITFNCRDSKKEQDQVESALKSIDSVEIVIETSVDQIEHLSDEAEMALKELDSL